jgi:hypothetical protein
MLFLACIDVPERNTFCTNKRRFPSAFIPSFLMGNLCAKSVDVSNPLYYDDGLDNIMYGHKAAAPFDYTIIVTKDITNLRNKIKELSASTDDKVWELYTLCDVADFFSLGGVFEVLFRALGRVIS